MNNIFNPLISRLEKFVLYETHSHFYLIGHDLLETSYRVIKIDRRIIRPKSLQEIIKEDVNVYSKNDLEGLLDMINEGNRTSGGLIKITEAYGVIGFVKFLDGYYLNLITQIKQVGCIAGNYIYTIKGSEIFPIRPRDDQSNIFANLWRSVNKKLNQSSQNIAESRYMALFQFVDITKDFYFSYTFDITYSLQHNFLINQKNKFPSPQPQEIFTWNYYQTHGLESSLSSTTSFYWVLPIIHGSYEQRRFSIFGRTLDMILIGRRSRHYAGTRYNKRGTSVHGKVANDCETEQILQLDGGLQTQYSSYVQMRGSIPTYWKQETSVTMPKPPILIDRVDPSYLATQEHFSDLFRRYNSPIIVLDLVKQEEKKPRESLVGREFLYAIEELNTTIPFNKQIRYCALDHSRITKSKNNKKDGNEKLDANDIEGEWALLETSLREEAKKKISIASNNSSLLTTSNTESEKNKNKEQINILRELEDIAIMSIYQTGIFCLNTKYMDNIRELDQESVKHAKAQGYMTQNGVLRTNCIDCLDRTNGGQFAMGSKFLAVSFRALGLSNDVSLQYLSNIFEALIDMYSVLGDRIALQYGGSEAHKKMSTGKQGEKQKSSSSKGGELLTSVKRYYNNAFTDDTKQHAINVFLGYYVPHDKTVPLWDLESDRDLHNKELRPPIPYVNKILFNELREKIVSEVCSVANNYENVEKILKNAPKCDLKTVKSRYLIHPSTRNIDAIDIITRSEKRKFVAKNINERVINAVQLWWRDSLKFYENKYESNSIKNYNYDGVLENSYFERVHLPNELTMFDDLLDKDKGTDNFLAPTETTDTQSALEDISQVRLINLPTIGGINVNVLKNTLWDLNHDDDEDDDEIGKIFDEQPVYLPPSSKNKVQSQSPLSTIDENDDIDSHENTFGIGKLVRGLGNRARSLVGGILAKKEGDQIVSEITSTLIGVPSQTHGISNWTTNEITNTPSAISRNNQESITYDQYVNIVNNTVMGLEKNCIDEAYSGLSEFTESLNNFTVNCDDVKGMENLSLKNCVTNIIQHGIYEGMKQRESAFNAHYLLANTLIFIEPDLQNHLEESVTLNKESSLEVPQMRQSITYSKAESSRRSITSFSPFPKLYNSLEPPINIKEHANLLLSKGKVAIGIELELQKNMNRYLFQQVLYDRELDNGRLSKRLSNSTTQASILKYASLYDKDSFVSDFDNISYIATDASSYQNFNELETIFDILSPEHERYNENVNRLKKSISLNSTSNESIASVTDLKIIDKKNDIIDVSDKSLSSPNYYISDNPNQCSHISYMSFPRGVHCKEYSDFLLISPDLYKRVTNKYLRVNEISAESFSLVKNIINKK